MTYQKKVHLGEIPMPTYFHAGETHNRNCTNLQSAIQLGTKRIGHAFQLFIFPHLQEKMKELDICIESCPLSNMVLGYTKDLRVHPVNYLMSRGLQVSISSDDPGLFGYEGVTLDYAYATGAWELTIRDLKQLSLNGIKYSSVSEAKKKELYALFDTKWKEWIDFVNTHTINEKPKLHYFDMEGRAGHIRFALEACGLKRGVDYEDCRYTGDSWKALKASGKLEFGQIPMFELEDGTRLVQSMSIFNFIIRKYGKDRGLMIDDHIRDYQG